MLRLTKVIGNEMVLVNPDHIMYVEKGGGGVANVYLARGEMMKVVETIEEIAAMMGGSASVSVGPVEFKDYDVDLDTKAVLEFEPPPEGITAGNEEFSIPASAFAEAEEAAAADESAPEKPSRKNK